MPEKQVLVSLGDVPVWIRCSNLFRSTIGLSSLPRSDNVCDAYAQLATPSFEELSGKRCAIQDEDASGSGDEDENPWQQTTIRIARRLIPPPTMDVDSIESACRLLCVVDYWDYPNVALTSLFDWVHGAQLDQPSLNKVLEVAHLYKPDIQACTQPTVDQVFTKSIDPECPACFACIWVLDKRIVFPPSDLGETAVQSGNVRFFTALWHCHVPFFQPTMCAVATKFGRFTMLKTLLEFGFNVPPNVIKVAIRKQWAGILHLLIRKGIQITVSHLEFALDDFHTPLEVFQALLSTNIQVTNDHLNRLLNRGRSEVVDLFVEKGCQFTTTSFTHALKGCKIDLVRKAFDAAPVSEITVEEMADAMRNLEVVKFLCDKSLAIVSEDILKAATYLSNRDQIIRIIEMLMKYAGMTSLSKQVYVGLIEEDNLPAIRKFAPIISRDGEWPLDIYNEAVEFRMRAKTVKFLLELGVPIHCRAIRDLARKKKRVLIDEIVTTYKHLIRGELTVYDQQTIMSISKTTDMFMALTPYFETTPKLSFFVARDCLNKYRDIELAWYFQNYTEYDGRVLKKLRYGPAWAIKLAFKHIDQVEYEIPASWPYKLDTTSLAQYLIYHKIAKDARVEYVRAVLNCTLPKDTSILTQRWVNSDVFQMVLDEFGEYLDIFMGAYLDYEDRRVSSILAHANFTPGPVTIRALWSTTAFDMVVPILEKTDPSILSQISADLPSKIWKTEVFVRAIPYLVSNGYVHINSKGEVVVNDTTLIFSQKLLWGGQVRMQALFDNMDPTTIPFLKRATSDSFIGQLWHYIVTEQKDECATYLVEKKVPFVATDGFDYTGKPMSETPDFSDKTTLGEYNRYKREEDRKRNTYVGRDVRWPYLTFLTTHGIPVPSSISAGISGSELMTLVSTVTSADFNWFVQLVQPLPDVMMSVLTRMAEMSNNTYHTSSADPFWPRYRELLKRDIGHTFNIIGTITTYILDNSKKDRTEPLRTLANEFSTSMAVMATDYKQQILNILERHAGTPGTSVMQTGP